MKRGKPKKKKRLRDQAPPTHRGFIRDVALVYRWSRIPHWLDPARPVTSAREAWPYFRPLEQRVRETLMALYLNSANRPIARETVHVGTIKWSVFSPAEVLRSALHLGATAVIVAHNHPSMELKPSVDDQQGFDELKKAAALFEIKVLDSLIIVPGNYFSIAQASQLQEVAAWCASRRRMVGSSTAPARRDTSNGKARKR